jgi:hypothetical protein
MRRRIPLHSLKEIDLCSKSNSRDPEHILDPKSLYPLFAFPHLEALKITIAIWFDRIDNALMKDAAAAWPHLRALIFQYQYDERRTTSLTVEGLLPLAYCRSLTVLLINLDPTISNTNIDSAHQGVFNPSFCYLGVGQSPITDPGAVASFLFDVFPNLIDISAWAGYQPDSEGDEDPEVMEMVRGWAQAKKLYRDLVSTHEQQRGMSTRWPRYL